MPYARGEMPEIGYHRRHTFRQARKQEIAKEAAGDSVVEAVGNVLTSSDTRITHVDR
jgi:hypothetical protein